MKTPDEINKGLECCRVGDCDCENCSYKTKKSCMHYLKRDALAYIQQLERERDAAVNIMRELISRMNAGEDVMACEYCDKQFGVCNCNCLRGFELRGVQEVE